MPLTLRNLSVTRRKRLILDDISLSIAQGEFVGLIGPNGAGKSTLMEASLGLIPSSGTSSLAALPPHKRARVAAYLPQAREISWPVSVEDLIALGRIPWSAGGQADTDRTAVDHAITRMGLQDFRRRTALRLSGGEQNRVLIARALAQETPMLLADEPVAGLDPAQQLACMRLFRDLAQESRCVIASVHDLGLAARFCTRLVLLSQGRILADGPPDTVLTDDNLRQAFAISVRRLDSPEGPVFVPY